MYPVLGVSTKSYMDAATYRGWLSGLVESVDLTAFEGLVFIAPSHPLLVETVEAVAASRVRVCAQDVSAYPAGAHTGEVPASLLAELGVSIVELGHAERRRNFGENSRVLSAKVSQVLEAGLTPLICVGESERTSIQEAAEMCIRQLSEMGLGADVLIDLSRHTAVDAVPPLIAYEPVWAIGASEPAAPEYIRGVVDAIREKLGASFIIYGGSAKPGLFRQVCPPADGLFLGRFAHNLSDLRMILTEAYNHSKRD